MRRIIPLIFLCSMAHASFYAFVQVSTSAIAGTDSKLLDVLTSQFITTVVPNPLATGTYSIIVNSPNANYNYNPPLTNTQLLNALVETSTSTYVYGFADGMDYQRTLEQNAVVSDIANCSDPGSFNLGHTTSDTFDASTCIDVGSTIEDDLFNLSLSTPTVIP